MNNEKNPIADDTGAAAVDPLVAAIDAGLRALDDPTLTRIGHLRGMLRRARLITVHAAHQAEAARALEEFLRLGIDALRTDVQNSFTRLPDLPRRFQLLTQPPPPRDEGERIAPFLRAAGWSSGEIDLLRRMLKPREKMISCDAAMIRLETRTLTRRAIRDGGRPKTWTNLQSWERQFQRDGVPLPGEKG